VEEPWALARAAPLWGAAAGHLMYEEAKVAIKGLSQSSLWISQTILEKAYRALDEIFDQ